MAFNVESLLKILHQILHPQPRIHLDPEQKMLVESLLEKVNFVKEVFENPTGGLTTHGIERRITDAAHDAEDVIESHLANHLLLTSEDLLLLCSDIGCCCIDLLFSNPNDAEDVIQSHLRDQILMICPLDLQRVIENFELIKEEITKMMDKIHTTPGPGASSSSSLPVSSPMGPNPHNIVVGINEDLIQLKHKLTNDYEKNLEVITIVGMGGIGKTTLAQNLYNDRLIGSHFDMRAWITISQAYDMRRILLDFWQSILGRSDELMEKDNHKLALKLYQILCGRRYLIVLDDMWSSQDWDSMKRLFPNNHNGSRVIVTTRELTVANYVGSYHHQMKFLHDEESWNLLNTKVFGEETCPPELERIGHVIAQDCKGLPLAVDVISGILAQLPRTQEAWEEVARDVSLAVTNTDDNQFANIMLLSYNHLPCHLKPCFLYMAAFPEDLRIPTSTLVRLWVAEGFLKPILHESMEDVAKVYLKALVDRNLILVCERSKTKDNVKSYVMHDLMRDLCIRKAQEENFLRISMSKVHIQDKELSSVRRICEHDGLIGDCVIHVETAILCRTILLFHNHRLKWSGLWGLRLLRVLEILKIEFEKFPKEILKLINLRYLALSFKSMITIPISLLCNLQTICFHRPFFGDSWTAKGIFEILMIPQLRHLIFIRQYPMFDLQPGQILTPQEDLQTLSNVGVNSSLQKLLETTPNLKKLGIRWRVDKEEIEQINVNLACLSKLESLKCIFSKHDVDGTFLSHVIFPPSLKKLTLSCAIKEQHLNNIAMLPNLQVLKLVLCKVVNAIWEPREGGFDRLKYLLLDDINLKNWIANETHYPRLEHLTIRDCHELEEIPTDFGEIATLELIELQGECTTSALESARQIQREQLELDNDALQVHITNIQKISP